VPLDDALQIGEADAGCPDIPCAVQPLEDDEMHRAYCGSMPMPLSRTEKRQSPFLPLLADVNLGVARPLNLMALPMRFGRVAAIASDRPSTSAAVVRDRRAGLRIRSAEVLPRPLLSAALQRTGANGLPRVPRRE